METRRAKLQQQQQKVSEKQSPWVLATPAMPVTPEKRTGFSDRPRDLRSTEMATSSRSNEAANHNIGSYRTILANPTTGFPQVHFGNVLVLTDPAAMQNIASFAPAVIVPIVGSNDQTLLPLNGNLLLSGSVCNGGNHSQDGATFGYRPNLSFVTDEAARTSTTGAVPLLLAPVTPAKGKQINDPRQQEMNKAVEKELILKGGKKEDGQIQCSETVHHDSSKLVSPITPDKGKTLEDNPREVINPVDVGLTRDGSMQEWDQSSGHSAFKRGTCSQEQGVELPTHTSFSSYTDHLNIVQDEERIDQGRNLSSTRKKKATRKKHRPKVLKDGLLASKKPVTPKPVTPKQVRKKDNQTGKRSYVRKKKSSNCPNTTPDTTRDINEDSSAVRKSPNQHTENGTKFVRRRLHFESESQSVDEHLEQAFTKSEPQERGRCADTATSSRARLTVQLGQGMEVEVEESEAGIAFDLNRSLNQMLDDYIRLPENPTLPLQPSRRELLKKNWKDLARKAGNANSIDNTNFVGVSKLQNTQSQMKIDGDTDMILIQDDEDHKQTKSNHSHVDNAQSGYTYPTSSDKYFMQPQVCDSPHFPQECKRRRTGTEHDRGEFGQMTRNDSRLLSSADEQKVVSTNKLQAPDFMLAFGPTKGATKKRSKTPIRAHKSAFNVIVTGCDQPLETHESGHHAFLEALFADTHTCMKTGKPTRKKQVHTKSILNIDREHEPVHFLGQKLVGLPSTSEDFHDLQIIPIQECQRRSNILEPFCTNLMSQAIVPYIDPADNYMDAAAKPQHSLVSYGSSMIVPYTGTYGEIKKKCPRAKVDLDDETNRVWKLLMGKMVPDAQEGSDVDKEEMWEEQRKVFRGRADSFIARMSLIQGDRQFSPWKGSVLDSVIGVFLTQNVSDHLSSSAFMALAAKFPLNPRKDDVEKRMCTMTEGYGSLPSSGKAHCQEQVLCQKECELGSSITYHTGDVEENKMDKANESTRMNTKASDSFGGVVINLRRRESGVSPETPGDRTQISTTITMNSESEDKRSLDDAVSSQNSVSSSDGSSNCLSQKTNSVGSGPHTHLDTDQRNGAMVSDLDGYALCQKHIQISGANIMQEIYNHDNDENMLSEQCGTVDQKSEKKIGLTDGLQSLRYSCQEISCAANLQLNFSQQDSTGMPSVVSESSDSDNMENADVIRMQSTSSLLFPDPWTTKTDNIMVHRNCKESSKNSSESESQQSSPLMSNVTMSLDACLAVSKQSLKSLTFTNEDEATTKFQQSERNQDCQARKTQHEDEYSFQKQHCQPQEAFSNSCDDVKGTLEVFDVVEPNSKVEVCSPLEPETETSKGTPRSKKTKAESEKEKNFDWDSLRKEACHNGYKSERSQDRMDSMDWEAIRHSDIREISETIRERGMNNVLAGRIKDFLNRLVGDHGSLDLEWLRDVPPDKAKEYLLSIRGLGLKSVECVRLLTLHQHAFPVDTNVGRICVRLGWVPLQPLPEYLQLHLLETYPVLATIQKYLWPRLCTLDQRTLYELHYQMITFGKVFCTKSKPNCNACPMRGECRHFASAFASARLALPGPEERRLVKSTFPSAPENPPTTIFDPMPPCQIGDSCFLQGIRNTNEPIIEEPPSPEPECQGALAREIEEAFYEDPYEIPTTDLNLEDFTLNLQNYMQENMELQDGDIEKALVAITREAASIPVPKLKNVSRLRTEHQVYELPDAHPLLEGLEPREYDDPCPYLLSIWAPGETARSTKPPETCCSSPEMDNICEDMTCFACSCRREEQAQTVRGTLLIPCRTANRGSFPLNGTYFQVNEVFADHQSSHSPLIVPRRLIWNLPRRIVYFGTSIPTLFRGLTIDEIQLCFSRGFVCLRGFDRKTRAPRPLSPRLHLAASHAPKEKKTSDKDEKKASQKTARKS